MRHPINPPVQLMMLPRELIQKRPTHTPKYMNMIMDTTSDT